MTLVADLGDGAAGRGLVGGQQVEDDTSILLDGAQALDVDLLAAQLFLEVARLPLVRGTTMVKSYACMTALLFRAPSLSGAHDPTVRLLSHEMQPVPTQHNRQATHIGRDVTFGPVADVTRLCS